MTPEEIAKRFCVEHTNPNWARHHAPALAKIIHEVAAQAHAEGRAERDAEWATAVREFYGNDLPSDGHLHALLSAGQPSGDAK